MVCLDKTLIPWLESCRNRIKTAIWIFKPLDPIEVTKRRKTRNAFIKKRNLFLIEERKKNINILDDVVVVVVVGGGVF